MAKIERGPEGTTVHAAVGGWQRIALFALGVYASMLVPVGSVAGWWRIAVTTALWLGLIVWFWKRGNRTLVIRAGSRGVQIGERHIAPGELVQWYIQGSSLVFLTVDGEISSGPLVRVHEVEAALADDLEQLFAAGTEGFEADRAAATRALEPLRRAVPEEGG